MNAAMSSNERVRLARWVNKVEETADILLDLLKSPPDPLPRQPVIDPELVDLLASYTFEQDQVLASDYDPEARFLKLGNGNQVFNKKRALACAVRVLEGAEVRDKRTISVPGFGLCHFAAYTHLKGAMISTPGHEDNSYGAADWHSRDHLMLFRDAGDGRCIIYISPIEPLFALRNIGHHGVTWDRIAETAKFMKVISSSYALEAEEKAASPT
jgi:hypothetical protein